MDRDAWVRVRDVELEWSLCSAKADEDIACRATLTKWEHCVLEEGRKKRNRKEEERERRK